MQPGRSVDLTDDQLTRPLARFVRTQTKEPERSAEHRAELASIVRQFGGKQCVEVADRLKRENGGEKIWPEALDRALNTSEAKPFVAPKCNMQKRVS